nr:retinol dehydrogenase 12-like [Leptinotarsa decemlineata]
MILSGLGYQAALTLASRGCRLIIADKVDATETREKIIKETKNPNVVVKHLDLGSFESVRKFAKEIIETEPRLHVLINNAGIGTTELKYTEDGLQKTMQVNYFGHFLLTHLLIDLLKKSGPSRIIFTSSCGAYWTRMEIEDLNPSKDIRHVFQTYNNSKLCQAIAAKGFAEKLAGTDVTAYSLHPGVVRSTLFWKALHEEKTVWSVMLILLTVIYGKSTEEGAQTMIHLATDEGVTEDKGKLFLDCRKFFYPFQMYDDKFCKDVWEKSIQLCKMTSKESEI